MGHQYIFGSNLKSIAKIHFAGTIIRPVWMHEWCWEDWVNVKISPQNFGWNHFTSKFYTILSASKRAHNCHQLSAQVSLRVSINNQDQPTGSTIYFQMKTKTPIDPHGTLSCGKWKNYQKPFTPPNEDSL